MRRIHLQYPMKSLVFVVVVYVVVQAAFWATTGPDEHTTPTTIRGMTRVNGGDSKRTVVEHKHEKTFFNSSEFSITMQKLAENYTIVRGLSVRTRKYCGNSVTTLAHHSVLMNDVIMDTNYLHKLQNKNLTQKENDLELRRGLLVLNTKCSNKDFRDLISRKGRWERNWNSYIVMNDGIHKNPSMYTLENGVVVKRFEYLNVYWTILDLYNIYLALMLFEKQPEKATIIFADDHPGGNLDPLWSIFGPTIRLTEWSKRRMFFSSFIWMAHRDYDPILQTKLPIPLFSYFRDFVYKRYGYSVKHKNRCSRSLNIVLILRPDTSQSESRLRGAVRSILNFDAVIKAARATFPEHNISGIRMDTLHVSRQIEIVSTTDVLMGMHGAGLAYGALLQPGSAVVEIFPYRYQQAPNNHMELLAKGNGAFYLAWFNKIPMLEDKFDSIQLPIPAFLNLVRKTLHTFCTDSQNNK